MNTYKSAGKISREFKLFPIPGIRIVSVFLFFSFLFPGPASAQKSDTAVVRYFGGVATFTTKGLSTFPNLTLGKPAAIFEFSAGSEKFRFEPLFRFALDGKP